MPPMTTKLLLAAGLLVSVACNEPTSPPVIVSLTVAPSSDTVLVGRAVQLTATTRDASGNALTGPAVTWTSSNSIVATVSVTGLVTGVSAGGPVTVTATSVGKSGTAAIAVIPAPTVSAYPNSIATVVGGSVFFQAVLDSAGNAYFLNGPVTWASNTPAVATARDTLDEGVLQGFVTGLAIGSATITATTRLGPATATISVAQPRFAAVSSGGDHTCGLTTTGAAFCWGNDDYGALGAPIVTVFFTRCLFLDVANLPCSAAPVSVTGGLTFATISAGSRHTCALAPDGTAYCWGWNSWPYMGHGWLGTGDTVNRAVPTPVMGGLAFAAISAGGRHTCGLTPNGVAYCWGFNAAGQLGTGDDVTKTIQTAVIGR